MRRVLILSASAGAGHLRAAEALQAACRLQHPNVEVRHVDALTLTPKSFRKMYGEGYLEFVRQAPELVGFFYDRTDRPPRHPTARRLAALFQRLNTRPLRHLLQEFQPDVVAHTHFLPAAVVAHEIKRKRFAGPHLVCVTDYEVHRFWICPGIDRYCVAREENRVHLAALGQPADRIRVTGIPIDPVFARAADLPALRRKHGIAGDRPVLLVLGGGFGVGPVESLVETLWRSVDGAQIVVVAGRNEALRDSLVRRAEAAPVPTRVLGFTREMHEWMALASLAVTKPGGLTTSEALALGLPLVITNPIPGQETRNATVLLETGAAISGENPLTLGFRVARLLADRDRLGAMSRAAASLGRPGAATEVVEELSRLTA